ncbi:hypothetical protein PIECOFPK_00145 [Mycovorax composti]|jgi:hypothetical protein|uniref:SnoaL-like domain-containing protein n=2 Tax=Chitinophagaceae TaxID=563835 RepID=A0ABZ2EGK1_9BACT
MTSQEVIPQSIFTAKTKTMEKAAIARSFSTGNFKPCYPYLSDATVWDTPGQQTLKGASEIVPFCEKIRDYFDSITTDFRILHVLENDNSVVVNGTATFIREDVVISEVASCDIYIFNEDNTIASLYSYCVKTK